MSCAGANDSAPTAANAAPESTPMPDHADPVLDVERAPLVFPAAPSHPDRDDDTGSERPGAPTSRDTPPRPAETPPPAPRPPGPVPHEVAVSPSAGPTTAPRRRKALRWTLMTAGPVAVVAAALYLYL